MRLHAVGNLYPSAAGGGLSAVLALVRQLPGTFCRWSKEAGFAQAFQDLLEGKGTRGFCGDLA